MSKSVTVQFDDGTSHIYEDVPDHITDDQVKARAKEETGKNVQLINAPTETQTAQQNFQNQSLTDRALGGLAAGSQLAGQALTSPLGHIAEIGLGGKYIADKIAGAIRGPVQPNQAMLNPAWDNALKQPIKQPGLIEQGMHYAKQGMARANSIAELAAQKAMQNAGNIGRTGVGLGAMMYSPSLNTNEQQELQRRRGMGPTITQ